MSSENVVPFRAPGKPAGAGSGTLAGVNEPRDPGAVAPEDYVLPEPDPQLQAMFDATDKLFEGMTSEQALASVGDMYFDGDGMPQLRRSRIRAVPDPE